jgi:tetratricopeptide (TPR) repeat protein
MKKLSISQLFASVVGLAIALVLFIVWFSSYEMKQLGLNSKQNINQAVQPLVESAKTGIEVQRTRINLRDYLLSSQIGQSAEKQLEFKKRYHQLSEKINERIGNLNNELKTQENSQLMKQIEQQWGVLQQVVKDIEQAIESNNHPLATEFMLTRCYAAAGDLTDSLYQLDALLEKTTHDALEQQINSAEKTKQQMLYPFNLKKSIVGSENCR